MSSAAASASAAPTAPVKAPPQAGVLEGVNPVHFDAKNPIILFIVQVSCRFYIAFGAKLWWREVNLHDGNVITIAIRHFILLSTLLP